MSLGESGDELDESDDIAIIGMACRFPGAPNIESFWNNLRNGVESIKVFSDEEVMAAGVAAERLRDPCYVKAGAVIDDIDKFDAAFFGVSPKEAKYIDPQHRLFLECAWTAMESAGYGPGSHPRATGVYAAANLSNYLLFNILPTMGTASNINLQILMGNDKDYLATYVSYKLDLRGPSIAVQTACSSSLVAVHLACQGLIDGQCDMAIAGGVSLNLPEHAGYSTADAVILSPDGHCRAFDAEAHGTVPGDGVGIVVLKRLADALADGDTIHAVVRGTASNNDGSAKVGFTAPSVDGQAAVIAEALAMARATPDSISYIEAHGTGTALGDMVEIAALTQVYGKRGDKPPHCALGAVKANIGHLWTAAGIAGFIKTALLLEHHTLVPSLHFRAAHPQSALALSRFYINTILSPWDNNQGVCRAGVSAFGIGGTNAHAILQEAPPVTALPRAAERGGHVLVLSAKSEAVLKILGQRYQDFLTATPGVSIGDVCYTASLGRMHHAHRLAICAADLPMLQVNLRAFLDGQPEACWQTGRVLDASDRRVVFVCSGVQPPPNAMLAGLIECEPVFRRAWERCEDGLRRLPDASPSSLLSTDDDSRYASLRACATNMALAELWRSWGVQPDAVLGLGLGEYAASTIAGTLSIEDAMFLAASHAQIMEDHSGDSARAPRATQRLDTVRRSAAVLAYSEPTISWISSVSSQPVASSALINGEYWSHLWASSEDGTHVMSALPALGYRVVIELEDRRRGSAEFAASMARVNGLWCAALSTEEGGHTATNPTLAALYVRGASINWRAYYAHYQRRRVPLPTYPFERVRHWIEPPVTRERQVLVQEDKLIHPLLGRRLHSALSFHQYENVGDPGHMATSLAGELPRDANVTGVALVEIMLAAACFTFSSESVMLQDIVLPGHQEVTGIPLIQTIVTPEFNAITIEIYAATMDRAGDETQWRRLAQARATVFERTAVSSMVDPEFEAARGRCGQPFHKGIHERWQIGSEVWHGNDEWLVRYIGKKEQTHLDLGAVALTLCLPGDVDGRFTVTPVRIERLRLIRSLQNFTPADNNVWIHLRRHKNDTEIFDLRCFDAGGAITLELLAIHQSKVPGIIPAQILQPIQPGLAERMLDMSEVQRTTHISSYLRTQIARTVGVAEEQVPLNESVSALGVDSFSFMEIANAVRRDLGIELTPGDYYEYASLAAMSTVLMERLQLTTASSTGLTESQPPISESASVPALPLNTLLMATANATYTSSLVRIQPKGHLAPLFCLHPSGGQVFVYHPLIEALGSARPIYGIQSRALNDYRLEHASLDDMAADYVEVMRRQCREGPYHILGWSMGGRLAISIAKLLEQSGDVVGFVGLWDSRVPTPDFAADLEEPVPGITMAYGGAMLAAIHSLTPADRKAMRETLQNASPDERLQRMILWSQERGVLPADIPFSLLFQQAALVDQHVALLDAQTPGTVCSDLYVWWARAAMQRWPTTDWTAYTRGEVFTHIVEGDHFSIVRPPNIHTLTQQLKGALERVEQGFKGMATVQASGGKGV